MKTAKALLILMGVLSLASVAKADGYAPWDQSGRILVAQKSSDEWRSMRDRWEDLPPEQREYRRRELMERWRNLPPQEREQFREEMMDSRGFGRGFEHRQYGDEDSGSGRRGRGR